MFKSYGLAVFVSLIFFAAYTSISLQEYYAHHTRGDLTAYAQGMWNTLHGNFMASTYNYSAHNYWDRVFREITPYNSNIMGIHFNPILLILLPFYALHQSPETLLILQSLLVAAGGFVIYLIAKNILDQALLPLVLQSSYLLYISTVTAVLSQFHALTLSLFFAPLLILASRKRSKLFYYLCLILFWLVQENTSLIAVFFGLYLLVTRSQVRRGLTTAILSLIYFCLVTTYIIPTLSPYHFYLFGSIYGSPLGASITQIIFNSFRHPFLFATTLFTPANISYLGKLLLGVFPFALGSPLLFLVSLSALAQNLLSSSTGLKAMQMHYESGSVAFLFLALIMGIQLFLAKTKLGRSSYGIVIVLLSLATTTAVSYKTLTSHRLNPRLLFTQQYTPRDLEADSLLRLIPPSASVSTQDYLSAHLASRKGLYQFPVYATLSDYLLLATDDQVWPLTSPEQGAWLEQLRASGNYRVVKETEHFVLFARSLRPSQ